MLFYRVIFEKLMLEIFNEHRHSSSAHAMEGA
jgi:hypothetical protein